MSHPKRTIAVLVGTPALSSIIATTLAMKPAFRVREFETLAGIETYMRIAPVDLLVADFDNAEIPADQLARHLRGLADTPRHLQIVALASQLGPTSKAEAKAAGIDEVIVKPMSPRYLVERVVARTSSLRRAAVAPRGLTHRDWSVFGDNIVPLFRPANPAGPHF